MENLVITASVVDLENRVNFLPKLAGKYYMQFEPNVYCMLERFCSSYTGAYWQYVQLSNSSGFLYPVIDGELNITNAMNYFSADVDAETAGIIVTLFTFAAFAEQVEEPYNTMFYKHYVNLLNYVETLDSRDLIFSAID